MISFLSSLLFSLFAVLAPESFGAVGDGVHDDAPAFRECIRRGGVTLRKNATYRLCTPLERIKGDSFTIDGNGAKVIIDRNYHVDRSDLIFSFDDSRERAGMFVSDVTFISELGKKFADKDASGDTYVFYIGNAREAVFSNVVFEDKGQYNNVSFIVTAGCDLSLRNCRICSRSLSHQGGAVWFMNRCRPYCRLSFDNVLFDYDTLDECLCIGVDNIFDASSVTMDVTLSRCSFTSPGNSPSSGFVIVNNHCVKARADVRVRYNDCVFDYDGSNRRYIQSVQADSGSSFPGASSFDTEYRKCSFRFHPSARSEYGLVGVVPLGNDAVSKENVSYRFVKCDFDIDGVEPLIADCDGERKGCYSFEKCSVKSTGRVFTRKYNPGVGEIDIRAVSCAISSGDDYLTSENLVARSSSFNHNSGKNIGARRDPEIVKSAVVETKRCKVNGSRAALSYKK